MKQTTNVYKINSLCFKLYDEPVLFLSFESAENKEVQSIFHVFHDTKTHI